MNIKDLRDGMRTVEVECEVVEVKDPRPISLRTGGTAKVADAYVRDATGSIKLSLWDDQIELVAVGNQLHITNAYVNNFRGEIQLNVGRYGKIVVVK